MTNDTCQTTEEIIPQSKAFVNEIWKDIPGFVGMYCISSTGRVKSLPRQTWNGYGAGRILKQGMDRCGYPQIVLSKHNKHFYRKIHNLVLECFIGPRPEGFVACHFDGDKANNTLNNLRWDTPKENKKDDYRNGKQVLGHAQHASKLTEENVAFAFSSTLPNTVIAKMFNVTKEAIWSIKHRKSWAWFTCSLHTSAQ